MVFPMVLTFWLSHQYPICIPLRSHSCYMPCPCKPPWLDHSNYTGEELHGRNNWKLRINRLSKIRTGHTSKSKRLMKNRPEISYLCHSNASDGVCELRVYVQLFTSRARWRQEVIFTPLLLYPQLKSPWLGRRLNRMQASVSVPKFITVDCVVA
jgi:hypothetical protein